MPNHIPRWSRVALDTLEVVKNVDGPVETITLAELMQIPRRTAAWRLKNLQADGLLKVVGHRPTSGQAAELFAVTRAGRKALDSRRRAA